MVAQEVSAVLPEAVSTEPSGDRLLGLKPEALIPVLVEAIKEQQAEIADLKARVARLSPSSVAIRDR